MSGGPNENDYPKHPNETLAELIERERKAFKQVNTEYGTRLHAALYAFEDAMLRFETRMRELGRDEDYLEDESAVMRMLKGET